MSRKSWPAALLLTELLGRYTAFTAVSMAAGVSFAFPALWLSSYVWNTRAPGGALKPQHGRSWLIRPAAVRPSLRLYHEAQLLPADACRNYLL